MKRRILSFIMSMAVCLTLCPTWAAAEGEPEGGAAVTETAGAEAVESGPAPGGEVPAGEDTSPTGEDPALENDRNTPPSDTESAEGGEDTMPAEPTPAETDTDTDTNTNTTPPVAEGGTPPTDTTPAEPAPSDIPAGDAGAGDAGTSDTQPEPDPKLCDHHTEHTKEICGYVPADENGENGSPCTYKCQYCPIVALIADLPESVTQYNKEKVSTKIEEIRLHIDTLSLDTSLISNYDKYTDIKAQLEKLDEVPRPIASVERNGQEPITVETLADAFKEEYSGATVYLGRDAVLDNTITIPEGCSFTLDLGGHNINYKNTNILPFFSINGQSSLKVQGSGTITSQSGYIFQAVSGGTLILNGGTFSGTNNETILIAIDGTAEINDGVSIDYVEIFGTATINGGTITEVYNDGTLTLNGGAFSNIKNNSQTIKDLLGVKDDSTYYAYYLDGELFTAAALADKTLTGNITVKECTHKFQGTPNDDGTTHDNKTCLACNLPPVVNEPCTFEQNPDKEPTAKEHFGTCPDCGRVWDGAHTGEWSEDGRRTCTVCGLEQVAIAKMVRNNQTTEYLTELGDGTGDKIEYNGVADDCLNLDLTLLQDVPLGAKYIELKSQSEAPMDFCFTLDLNGHTLSSDCSGAAVRINGGYFKLKDSSKTEGDDSSIGNGKIEGGDIGICLATANSAMAMEGGTVSGKTAGIAVNGGLFLRIGGDKVTAAEGGYGLRVLNQIGEIQLSGGVFQGIECSEDSQMTLADLIGTRYAYYRGGKPVSPSADDESGLSFDRSKGEITVKVCAHEGQAQDNGDGTHGGTCAACGTELTAAAHVWNNEANPTACTVCGGKVIAKMDKMVGETITTEYLTKLLETANNDLAYKKDYDGATLTLLQDVDMKGNHIYLGGTNGEDVFSFTLDLNGHTLSSVHGEGVVQIGICNLTLMDGSAEKTGSINGGAVGIKLTNGVSRLNMLSGTVTGGNAYANAAINVHDPSTVNISGGTLVSEYYGLFVENSSNPSKITITGGDFQGSGQLILCQNSSGNTLADLLGEKDGQKCVYYRNRKPIAPNADGPYQFNGENGAVSVRVCGHEGQLLDLGNGTHGGTCHGCGEAIPAEPHVTDENGNCTLCSEKAAAKIEKEGEQPQYYAAQDLPTGYTNMSHDGETLTLLQDVNLGEEYIKTGISYGSDKFSFTLDLNGHTLTSANSSGAVQIGSCNFTLTDGSEDKTGTIAGEGTGIQLFDGSSLNMTGGRVSGSNGIEVKSGASLNISGGTVVGNAYDGVGLYVKGAGKIQLTGGTFQGVDYSIKSAVELADLLGEKDGQKCAYYRDGKPIAPNADNSEGCWFGGGEITVQLCGHEDQIKDLGDGTHGGTCDYCGTELPAEAHVWDNAANPTACTVCGGKVIAKMEQPGKDTVYLTKLLETAKPEPLYNESYDGATLTLLRDVDMQSNHIYMNRKTAGDNFSFTLDLNGHTLSSANPKGVVEIVTCNFTLQDNKGGGKIDGKTERGIWVSSYAVLNMESGTVSAQNYAIYVEGNSKVNISGGTVVSEDSGGLYFKTASTPATVRLTGGTFQGDMCIYSSSTAKVTLAEMLGEKDGKKCAFYKDGKPVGITKEEKILTGTFTVQPCAHEGHFTDLGDGAHGGTCTACGTEVASEAHVWDNEANPTACTVCGGKVIAKMDKMVEGTITTEYLTKLGDETNGKIEYNKENYHNVMLILLDDVPLGEKYIELNNEGTDPMDFVFSLDLNGHILSSTNPNGAVQINGGFFRLLDSSKRYGESSIGKGRIDGGDIGIRLAGTGSAMEMQDGTVSGNTAGIAVNGGSFLDIIGGKATATAEGGYGLRVAGKIEQANKIIGGTFQGIECSDGSQMTLAGLLREEFAYYREDGQPVEITKEGTSLTGTVTVQPCTHEGQIKDLGNGTHGGTCAYCTKEFETEAHIWNTDTADGIPACTGCGVRAIAEEKNEPNGETKYITKFQKEYDAKTNISIKLLQDVALVGEQISLKGFADGEYKFALDLNGKTLSSDYNGGVIVIAGRDFTLKDSSEDKTGRIDGGKIGIQISQNGILNMEGGTVSGGRLSSDQAAIQADSGSTVNISGGVVGSDTGKGLYVAKSYSTPATIQLTGGTFKDSGSPISCTPDSGKKLADLLAPGYAYYRGGKPIAPNADDADNGRYFAKSKGKITVQPCTHEGHFTDQGDNTHGGTCAACGTELEPQPHVVKDEANLVCEVCKAEVIAKIEKDGTIKYLTKMIETSDIDRNDLETEYSGAVLTLLRDVDMGDKNIALFESSVEGIFQFTIDLNSHKLSSSKTVVKMVEGGSLTIRDTGGGGQIISQDTNAVTFGGDTLNIEGGTLTSGERSLWVTRGNVNITGGTFTGEVQFLTHYSSSYEVNISGGTMNKLHIRRSGDKPITVRISGGTFGEFVFIDVDNTLRNILAEGHAYFNESDEPVLIFGTDYGRISNVTVKECGHTESSQKYEPLNDETHKRICRACGHEEPPEGCTFGNFTLIEGNGTYHSGVCEKCQYVKNDLPHEWEEKTETDGLTIEYYRECKVCGYMEEPFGTVTTSEREITLTYGETARLSIDAQFKQGMPLYQWSSGGTNISEESAYSLPTDLAAGEHTYTLTVKITDDKSYSYDFKVTVKPKTITDDMVKISSVKTTYTGLDQKPEITIDGLEKDTDYTESWSREDFTNVGTMTLTVTGTGNYAGTVTKTFAIEGAKPVVSWKTPSQTLTYTGSPAEIEPPTVTLVNNEAFDGTIVYSYKAESSESFVSGLPINAGKYSVRASIPAKGNYTAAESPEMSLTIEKSQPTIAFKASYKPDKTYDRQTIPNPAAAEMEITGADFKDVRFTWSGTPLNAGSYTLTAAIAETPNTKRAEASRTVTIDRKTVSNPVIELSQDTYEYDGTAKTPAVTVKDGETVIPASEYAIQYTGNTNAGTAKVTLSDKTGGNYNVSGSKDFTITKAVLESLSLKPNSFTYDGTAKAPEVTVKKGDSIVAPGEYEVSYSNSNGGEGNHTNAGTVTVTVSAKADGNYTGTFESRFIIYPKQLTVAGVEVQNRIYDGTNRVRITGVSLSGRAEGDEAAVNTENLYGTVGGSDAGTYPSVSLPEMSLAGADKANYTLARLASANVEVTIGKAPALTPKSGDLAVANGREHIYTYGVGGLRPDAPEGMSLGSSAVTYTLGEVKLGDYYSGSGAEITGQTLSLPIRETDSDREAEIGTVAVIIHTGNFEDMEAVIHVRSVNKIIPEGTPKASPEFITYGQALNAVTLSGTMRDMENNRDVPGTFTWSSPENRPAVQEKYAAAWVFTPEDNDTYAIVTGTVLIQVKPASIQEAVVELNQNSFRYDGNAQSPVIISVKLGDTILTEGTDYTAVIPAEKEPGEYAVTITGTGNYTGTAEKSFRINPVEQKPIESEGDTALRLEVETGLSTVPEALKKNPELDTPEKIETALRTKVEQVLDNVEERISVFDITLQYRDSEGTWHNVEPDNFPKDGVTTILPYPDGTGPTGFKFTIQHMISSGEKAGEVEEITGFELTGEGLKCKFWSLSPVAIGYEEVIIDPPIPPTPSNPAVTASDSDDGEEEAPDLEYEFWQDVRDKIEAANPGTTIRANAHGYDRMPRFVMDALRKSDNVTLVIRWDGGEDIVIPSSEALNEARRIYYPLSYLEGYRFNRNVPEEKAVDFSKQNPATGGFWEEDTPADVEAAFSAVEKAEITNPQRGLAETPELADKGIEKMIPGVYEPDTTEPEIQQAIETETLPTEAQNQDNRSRKALAVLALMLVAVCGGVWGWKHWFRNPKNQK